MFTSPRKIIPFGDGPHDVFEIAHFLERVASYFPLVPLDEIKGERVDYPFRRLFGRNELLIHRFVRDLDETSNPCTAANFVPTEPGLNGAFIKLRLYYAIDKLRERSPIQTYCRREAFRIIQQIMEVDWETDGIVWLLSRRSNVPVFRVR